jgi:hypothetical protein
MYGESRIFKEVKRIKIETDNIYPIVTSMNILKNGFVILFKATSSGNKPLLVTIDKKGTFLSKYDARGYGPGELMEPNNIFISDEEILVSESFNPVIHAYSNKLIFIRDYRIKKGGKILFADKKRLGIWSMFPEKDLVYLITIYNKENLNHIKYAYSIKKDKVPAFVQYYGNLCRIDKENFAGIYASDFQVNIFDSQIKLKRKLFTGKPAHVKKYHPWKGNRSIVNGNRAEEWINSWTVAYSVLFVDDHFLIYYREKNKFYLDVVDIKGTHIYTKQEMPWVHSLSDGKHLWRVEKKESTTDELNYYIIQEKLITRAHSIQGRNRSKTDCRSVQLSVFNIK